MSIKQVLLLLFSCFLSQFLRAQIDSIAKISPFKISGNADVFFRYAQNETNSSTIPSYAHLRPGLGWLNLITEGDFKRWGFLLELGAGERATQLYSAEGENFSYIIQSIAYYKLNEQFKASFGAFTTHFNYEWTEPGSNGNYTNTYIYTIIPASYTGLRLDYTINDKWSAMFGIYADSDRRIEENKGKHFGGQINYAGDATNNTVNFITGNDGDTAMVFMADCFGDHQFTKRFKLGWQLHFMHANDDVFGQSNWQGFALYFHEQIAPRFSLNLRSEWLNDPDGYWFGFQHTNIFSNTLTGKFEIKPFVIQPEIRLDRANEAVFERKSGNSSKQELSFLTGFSVFF